MPRPPRNRQTGLHTTKPAKSRQGRPNPLDKTNPTAAHNGLPGRQRAAGMMTNPAGQPGTMSTAQQARMAQIAGQSDTWARGRREFAAGPVGNARQATEQHTPENTTLPDVMRQAVARTDDGRGARLPARPQWSRVNQLPGYLQDGIRQLGRLTFDQFPCFQDFRRNVGGNGGDPIARVDVVANIGGKGPNRHAEIDAAANWVREHGVAVDATTMRFPETVPGYEPETMVACTEDRTFLMVREQAERSPLGVEATYIYSWPGGRGFYHRLDAQDQPRLNEEPALPGGRGPR